MWYWISGILVTIITTLICACIEAICEGEGGFTVLCFIICVSIYTMWLPIENDTKGTLIEYQTEEYKIIGLETNKIQESHFNGYFMLGCGFINGESKGKMKYIYFANTNYGKQLKYIDVDNVYIKETDEEEPKLLKIETEIHRKTNWIDRGFGHKKGEEIVTGKKIKGYILVVPKNTIKIDYNIDI